MFLRYVGSDPGDYPPGVHVHPEYSIASPEKKNPHVDLARGVLFVEPGDWVLYTSKGDPIAVLTDDDYWRLRVFVHVRATESTATYVRLEPTTRQPGGPDDHDPRRA